MELKTLKDIFNPEIGTFDLIWEIKKEAIKWLKILTIEEGMEIEDKNYLNAAFPAGTAIWIKRFFNITEEDLK